MALKFLNKKGWHTGSLRNIENVWKAEQKHDAEQKKLEELRKQIGEERERAEFRLLQEQAGLVPKQERLDFLYESGLAVGKGSSDGFKALETLPKTQPETATASSSSSAKKQQQSAPGALFEDKPQSANDAWRKLHSDPLLLIRQREQEALARVKNNPVQMAMIRKSVEGKKHKEGTPEGEERHKKHHHKKSKHQKHSSPKQDIDLENVADEGEERRSTGNRKNSKYDEHLYKASPGLDELREKDTRRERYSNKDLNHREQRRSEPSENKDRNKRSHDRSNYEKYDRDFESSGREIKRSSPDEHIYKAATGPEELHEKDTRRERYSYKDLNHKEQRRSEPSEDKDQNKRSHDRSNHEKYDGDFESSRREMKRSSPDKPPRHETQRKRQNKLSEEERAARLREMQMDAEVHEEQRWKRLKKAEEDDAREAMREGTTRGKNFLDAAHRSVYGAEKGGSSTIEESVRRRAHYSQGRSEASEANAFRR